jgi:hypothetical protein
MIAVVVAIMIVAAIMAPLPVLSLLIAVQTAEVSMRIVAGFDRPLVVKNHFVVIPSMIVIVVRIVNPVVPATMGTTGRKHGRKEKRTRRNLTG